MEGWLCLRGRAAAPWRCVPSGRGASKASASPPGSAGTRERKLDKLGVECVLKLREDYPREQGRNAPMEDYIRFFREKLLIPKKPQEMEEGKSGNKPEPAA